MQQFFKDNFNIFAILSIILIPVIDTTKNTANIDQRIVMCKLKKDLLKELYNYRSSTYKNLTEEEINQVRLVSSFGSDADIVKSVSKFERTLSRTRSFSSEDVDLRNTPTSILSPTVTQTKQDRKIVEYVKKQVLALETD